MTITKNRDGSYSAYQRAWNGTPCVAEASTRRAAVRACCVLLRGATAVEAQLLVRRRAARGSHHTRDCPSCERTGLMPGSGGTSAVACHTCSGAGEVAR